MVKTNLTNTTFRKVSIPHLTCEILSNKRYEIRLLNPWLTQNLLHKDFSQNQKQRSQRSCHRLNGLKPHNLSTLEKRVVRGVVVEPAMQQAGTVAASETTTILRSFGSLAT